MKVLKGLISIIILIALLLCQFVFLSVLACDKAFSNDSITEAVRKTQVSDGIVDQALQRSSLKDNETAKQALKALLKTEAGSEFTGKYASSAVQSILHKESAARLTQKDVNALISNGVQELSEKAGFGLNDNQKNMISAYVSTNSGDLLTVLNKALPTQKEIKQASGSQWKTLQNIRFLLSPSVKISIGIAVVILGLFLIFLHWRSKLGFLWWGIISLLCGAIFSISGVSTGFLKQIIQMPSGGDNAFILSPLSSMIEKSMSSIGIIALSFGAILILICFAARYAERHHRTSR